MNSNSKQYEALFKVFLEDGKISHGEREQLKARQAELGLSNKDIYLIEQEVRDNTVYKQQAKRFKYYAFISYSHKDEKHAAWLQKQLENFKLPNIIRKEQNSLPKSISPVFRDKTDVTPGKKVKENLYLELQDSQYLIIICSPSSAKSSFVNHETESFIQMGRADKIIPFIVDGEPNCADETRECYCPALKDGKDQLMGVSIDELSKHTKSYKRGRKEAMVKTVAALLNLKYENLSRRIQKRNKRKKQVHFSLAFIIVLALGVGLFSYWDYNRLKLEYYADYYERWNVPHGIIPVSKQQLKKRNITYEFTYCKNKLKEVRCINSYKSLRNELHILRLKRYPKMQFAYHDNNRPAQIKFYNINNHVEKIHNISASQKVVDIAGGISGKAFALNSGINTSVQYNNKSEIIRFLNDYDDEGRLLTQFYASDAYNTSVADANGVFGVRYDYNIKGLLSSITYLNKEQEPTSKKNILKPNSISWECNLKFKYNSQGLLKSTSYYDLDGQLTFNEWGYCIQKDSIDVNGNLFTLRFYDRNNKPVLNNEHFSQVKYAYNDRGDLEKILYLGLDEQPVTRSWGYASTQHNYNDTTKTFTTSFHDVNDDLCNIPAGYAATKQYFGAQSENVIEYFNENWKPCMVSNLGYFSQTNSFNQNGQLIECVYKDTTGAICNNNQGFAKCTNNYTNGLLIKQEYTSADPTANIITDLGYCVVKHEYTNQGNRELSECFDKKGNRVNNNLGYHSEKFSYDHYGNLVRAEFRDTSGRLANNSLHNAAIFEAVIEYKETGQISQIINWYDSENNLVTKGYTYQTTPMHIACGTGQIEMLRRLLRNNNELIVFDGTGSTPAQLAAAYFKTECLHYVYPNFESGKLITQLNSVNDLDMLICQLKFAIFEKKNIHYENARKLEPEVLKFERLYPAMVLNYYKQFILYHYVYMRCVEAKQYLDKYQNVLVKNNLGFIDSKQEASIFNKVLLANANYKEALLLFKSSEDSVNLSLPITVNTLSYANALLFNNFDKKAYQLFINGKNKNIQTNNNLDWNSLVYASFQKFTWMGKYQPFMDSILSQLNLPKINVKTKLNQGIKSFPFVGKWICHENNSDIHWEICSDGNCFYTFYDNNGKILGKNKGVWRAKKFDDMYWFEEFSGGYFDMFAQAEIKLLNKNSFELTILSNGSKTYQHKKRLYKRSQDKYDGRIEIKN